MGGGDQGKVQRLGCREQAGETTHALIFRHASPDSWGKATAGVSLRDPVHQEQRLDYAVS